MKCYLLLDRTGSMSDKWTETLSGINGYVSELATKGVEADVTLAMFDSQEGFRFDVIRSSVKVANWQKVTAEEAYPRGWTPLYDAIGRITAMAEQDAPDKAVIVVMTDGEENASTEMRREQAKAALDRCRARNWQVVFLGVGFDSFNQSASLGVGAAQTMAAPAHAFAEATSATAGMSADYAASAAPMEYTPSMREKAQESKVTGRRR